MISIGELTDWIIKHRRGKVFNYERKLIEMELCESIAQGVFVYQETEGQIEGVACGRRDTNGRLIHIYDVFTTKKGVLKNFMARFLLIYPDYKIEGRAHGRLRIFNNPKKVAERL